MWMTIYNERNVRKKIFLHFGVIFIAYEINTIYKIKFAILPK